MKCPRCGAELSDQAIFCTQCGMNLAQRQDVRSIPSRHVDYVKDPPANANNPHIASGMPPANANNPHIASGMPPANSGKQPQQRTNPYRATNKSAAGVYRSPASFNMPPQRKFNFMGSRQNFKSFPSMQEDDSYLYTTPLDSTRDTSPTYTDSSDTTLLIMEGNHVLQELNPFLSGRTSLSFGSADDNDIVIRTASGIVSHHHGFIQMNNGLVTIVDRNSKNGILSEGHLVSQVTLGPGAIATIGLSNSNRYKPILFLLSSGTLSWQTFRIANRDHVSIGRAADCDIQFKSPAISHHHCTIQKNPDDSWQIIDEHSYNGVFINGLRVVGSMLISPGCIVRIANRMIIFTGDGIVYPGIAQGVDVRALNLTKIRRSGRHRRRTTDNISLHIRPGEFVAIVGGSGSGKSTLLNELNGTDPASSGSVYIDNIDLYENYGILKNSIGYVPQQDIIYDNLKLIDMLRYAAKLRMPPETTSAERLKRSEEVIAALGLENERNSMIRSLSGGQKKRASIAVELLADPRLLFLDEPTSGLDPGIEQDLMIRLANMAHEGRTIILVTHTTLNLNLCDQIVFLGPGGILCFAGSYKDALTFFHVDDFVKIYEIVSDKEKAKKIEQWFAQSTYNSARDIMSIPKKTSKPLPASNPSFLSQLSTLSRRYLRLLLNDRPRLLLIVIQAPILAWLICIVAGENCFKQYEGTKSCLFALSCAAFWIGMLNSIQEICKERTILHREYTGGLRLSAYLTSKLIILGIVCTMQSLMLVGVFCAVEDVPEKKLLLEPQMEFFITTILLTFSATCLGLAISAIFSNPDRAIAVAPLLIMPQILFSGLVFSLKGISKTISTFVNCRWAMEAYGTTANLNKLDFSIYGKELKITDKKLSSILDDKPLKIDADTYPHSSETAYEYLVPHLVTSWVILGAFCIVCIAACMFILYRKFHR